MPLDVVAEGGQDGQHAETLDRHLLPHVVLGGGGPGEEGAHVLGKLAQGGGGPVVILNDLVVEGGAHADGAAWVVGVEVLAVPKLDARWRIAVAVEEMVDVVLIAVPGKGNN